jgi:murein DD-endopeptidase MepM/ murein hydrolase activator NlpD
MDTRRHAPLGRVRPRLVPSSSRSRPHAYLGRTGRPLPEIYASDHADSRQSGRFRWLLSTCLAGGVGALAIFVAIAGSMDAQESARDMFERLANAPLALRLSTARVDGLRWALPKTDKLVVPSGAVATTSYIADPIKERRGHRDYLQNKYYMRLVARLAPVSKAQAQRVPAFNPLRLYANSAPVGETDRPDLAQEADVKLIELNGILPNEDGQEMDGPEVAVLVIRAQAAEEASGTSGGELLAGRAQRGPDAPAPQTTILTKTTLEQEDQPDDFPGRALPPWRVQKGETLARILARLGAQSWQVRTMIDAARPIFPENLLLPGYEVRAITLPSPAKPSGEPVRVSIFDESGGHKVTITRVATGGYEPSATLPDERITASVLGDNDQVQDKSLYSSLHFTASRQGVPNDLILQIMRIHAYDTDFRQQVRVGDGMEFFFDMKGESKGIDGEIGDLLAAFVTAGGVTHKFYRFRASDGLTDFYDAEGSTSRKFLVRRPVRGEDVRLTSGYGWRRHPLLLTEKRHTGVDWATAHGTPIMAAGNGVIEEAGAKGEYGNYIRIRHANGYKTAYGHMSKYAPGVAPGVRVRQGQIIGYVGSTGLSSGPHLHFEVLVNGDFVNPMSIQVPNDRQLGGKDLADFKREKARIDRLMQQHPASTKVMTAGM